MNFIQDLTDSIAAVGFLAVIFLLLFLAGAVIFTYGLYNLHKIGKTSVVFGTVIGEEISYPTYRYEYGGKVYETRSVVPSKSKKKIGSVELLRIDPVRPEKIYEKSKYSSIYSSMVLCGLILLLTFGTSLITVGLSLLVY